MDAERVFVEEVLRTGLMLSNLIADLLEDMPDDAFPGENPAEVLVQMLTGSVRPVLEAAGGRTLEEATALLGAMADRTLADLRTALELSREG
jgi:hypothetical protein